MPTHNDARRLMFWYLQDNPDANLTQLAEDAAISLNHDEWLDDSDHWIWELAIEVFEKVNGEIK